MMPMWTGLLSTNVLQVRLPSPTPRRTLELLALIDQLKSRIHEANAIALFAAFVYLIMRT
jgi:hypothetical protein